MKKFLTILFTITFLIGLYFAFAYKPNPPTGGPAGGPAGGSPTPEQYTHDQIIITSPQPNDLITSPLTITGQAKGTWFFEASFPIKLIDGYNNLIGQTIAQAQGEWMTEDFVDFTATLEFTPSGSQQPAVLIFEKDNPSDIRELDDQFSFPVKF